MNTTTKRKVRLIKTETERVQRKRTMGKKEAISVPARTKTETNETKPPLEHACVHISPG